MAGDHVRRAAAIAVLINDAVDLRELSSIRQPRPA